MQIRKKRRREKASKEIKKNTDKREKERRALNIL
jgi:hypothetical protein